LVISELGEDVFDRELDTTGGAVGTSRLLIADR